GTPGRRRARRRGPAPTAPAFAAAARTWPPRLRAVSKRAGDGTASRNSTSPSVTRSCATPGPTTPGATTPGPLRLTPEANRDRRAEDERGGDALRAAIGAGDDACGLALLRPRREAREVETGRGLPRLGLGCDLHRQRNDLGTVRLGDVVGPLLLGPLPTHDVCLIAAVGLGRPPAVGVVQHRGDDVVDVESGR